MEKTYLGGLWGSFDRPVSHGFLPEILLEEMRLFLNGIRRIFEILQIFLDYGPVGLDCLAKTVYADHNESIEKVDSVTERAVSMILVILHHWVLKVGKDQCELEVCTSSLLLQLSIICWISAVSRSSRGSARGLLEPTGDCLELAVLILTNVAISGPERQR
jgi:hypothetical protein